MDPRVARFLKVHSDNDRSVREKAEPFRHMSIEERGRSVSRALSNLASFLEAQPERRAEILAWEEPRSPSSLLLWRRLVAEHRHARGP